jgi:formylglycine-generating enzyme required for sulfatase activity
MARIEKTVFISYRRKDISWALLVYKYLTAKGYDVFFDYTSIPSGDFEQIIVGNIKARAHFVLILTPTALDRCSEPGDWLRREIETAISERRNIIPLFFDGFNFGSPSVSEKLTGKLGGLKRYNGLEVPSRYFDEAMERLRGRYLKVSLDTVLHPVSDNVQKVVIEQQIAANIALDKKEREDKKERKATIEQVRKKLEKSLSEISIIAKKFIGNINFKQFGIGGIAVLLLSSLIVVGNYIFQNLAISITPTATNTNRPSITPSPPLGVGSTKMSEIDGMEMVYVPAGEFEMGSGNGKDDEKPVHTVYLDAFWIDQTEVTNGMYARCVNAGKCDPPNLSRSYSRESYYGNSEFDNYPVIYVSWIDADYYCDWAGRRLPTEAEWEKAASWDEESKKKHTYPWGDSIDCSMVNYRGKDGVCIGDTTEVGSYENGKNPYGLYDMAGNVWEWVADWYLESYYRSDPSKRVFLK